MAGHDVIVMGASAEGIEALREPAIHPENGQPFHAAQLRALLTAPEAEPATLEIDA